MKWFTRKWHSGTYSQRQSEKLFRAYRSHIESLPNLPASVRALALGISLHDGLMRRCRADSARQRLTLMLRCGDLQVGYFDLELRYTGVAQLGRTVERLKAVDADPRAESLYDEIDIGPSGAWVHRILFWPYREVAIEFEELGLRVEPRRSRTFRRRSE